MYAIGTLTYTDARSNANASSHKVLQIAIVRGVVFYRLGNVEALPRFNRALPMPLLAQISWYFLGISSEF